MNNLNKISPLTTIKQPILTDKTIRLTESRKYSFLVNLDSNKSEIKVAIENLFQVKIIKINTCKKSVLENLQAGKHNIKKLS